MLFSLTVYSIEHEGCLVFEGWKNSFVKPCGPGVVWFYDYVLCLF